jgi:hypothetical protein
MSRSKGVEDPHQDAVAILTRARYAREPHKLTEHARRAAAALLESILKVATEAGYEVRADAQSQRFIKSPGGGTGLVRITSDATGIHLAYFQLGQWAVVADPMIEFDPVKDVFVGLTTDESRFPLPGSPRQPPRTHAMTVVAHERVP